MDKILWNIKFCDVGGSFKILMKEEDLEWCTQGYYKE